MDHNNCNFPGAKEIPAGVEYYFNLNIFSGIELLIKLQIPNRATRRSFRTH